MALCLQTSSNFIYTPYCKTPNSIFIKTVGLYIHIITLHSGKTSLNFLQMQLNSKNSIVKHNCKVKPVIFHFNTRVLQKKSLLTYHTVLELVPIWALFCSIKHIHSKLTTFTPWLRDHKQYSRQLKYFFFCSNLFTDYYFFGGLSIQENLPRI